MRSTTNVAPTSALIVNRSIYAVGTNIGTAPVYRVVANSNLLTFTQIGLLPSTTYYYWVISYNDKCMGAPFYNMSAPLFGSATTCFTSTTSAPAAPVGGNDFTANWTAVAGATGYSIDVSTTSTFTALFPGYSALNLPVGTTSLVVSGLSPFTTYYYRVRALGPGCILNSATQTVTTTCGYYTIPYTQNFDTTTVGTVPSCYGVLNVNADANQWKTQSVNFASASNSIQINGGSVDMNDWFFLPGLSMTGGVSYRLKFSYNTGTLGSTSENLKASLGLGQTVVAMTTTLVTLTSVDNSFYETVQVDFTPASSGIYTIGFHGNSIAAQSYIVVDDISVTLSPTCIEPTDVTVSAVGATTATAHWTAATALPALGYQYYLSTTATPPTGATVPTGSVGAGITTLNFTSLSPSTFYWLWVRGSCSATDASVWSLEESFNTECSTPLVVSTVPVTRCGYGTVTLTATPSAGAAIRWYDAAFGGTLVGSGTTFTTAPISATTTYYAESRAFGAIAKLGPLNPTTQLGLKGVQNFQALVNFSVFSPTSLQSVDIFPMVSGQTGKLVVRNSANITLASFPFTTSVSGGATLQQITMNYPLVPGTYNLYFDTLPASGLRMNTTNTSYPYLSSVAQITGNNIDDLFQLGAYNWKFTTECLSSRVAVAATVTAPPSLSLSTSVLTICEDELSAPVMVVGGASYSTLVWSPSTGVSGSLAAGFTFNPTTTTTYTLLANQTSGSLCGAIAVLTVNVKQAPPAVSVLPVNPSLCYGSVQPLFGSTSIATPAVVMDEKFNAPTTNWVVANTSTGGNTTASQWTLKPSGYNYINGFGWNALFSSNDATQFYLANSDSQSGVVGTYTRTTLTSPAFSLVGYTSATLKFWHYIRAITFDKFNVQVSSDGGTVWTTVQSFTSVQGSPSGFVNSTVNLASYLGNANLKLRFNYESNWGYCWAVDNVLISGTLNAALSWSPATDLYTDADATVPYVAGTALTIVYTKPTSTITYTATLTGSNGCSRSIANVVTVSPQTVAGVLSSSQSICTGLPASDLQLTGSVGSVVRWEYADDAAFTVNVNPIASSSTTLTVAQMGVFSTIRYFRAVVKSGVCAQLTSNIVYVSFPSTTWNGSAWSAGVPTSSTRVIFNGAYSSTADLNACSVRINSGAVVFNAGHSLVVTNDVVVAGGSLTFEDASSLVQVNAVANSGNVTYKRNTMPMKRYDFTYWSTPVAPQTLLSLSPLTLYDKYFKFDPALANWVSIPATTLMDVGKGYIVRAPNSFSIVTGAVYNASFVGVPNNGTLTTPIVVSTSAMNLIGNPYPSAVNADLFLSDPANVGVVDATLYFWTHNTPVTANQYASNDYAVYNYLGGTGTISAPNVGVNSSVPNGKIASGQSFFIKGLSNGVATFTNAMRVVGNNNQFFRMAQVAPAAVAVAEKHRIWLDVVDASGGYKQTLVGYASGATQGLDRGYDGGFLNTGNSVALYSLLDAATPLSIQGRALPFSDSDEVPLGFYSSTLQNYTISLYDFDGLFAGQNIYLKDKVLDVVHDLKQAPYLFRSAAGTFNERFVLVYRAAVLGTAASSFIADAILVYKPDTSIVIDSGSITMASLKVYDVRGRLLLTQDAIAASHTSFDAGTTHQVLFIEITTSDGVKVTKKYIN
ncbi:MAG: hypothetical protein K2P85_12005 [Flavobacteriaceae bacterium]|nr:hypothetical protein [Flavobacteriaceae bacterium]